MQLHVFMQKKYSCDEKKIRQISTQRKLENKINSHCCDFEPVSKYLIQVKSILLSIWGTKNKVKQKTEEC